MKSPVAHWFLCAVRAPSPLAAGQEGGSKEFVDELAA